MGKSRITVDPVTRIEGHMKVEVEQQDGLATEARCAGTLFRGLELIMAGRDPRDAPILTQRICGVCPQAHATAAAMALDEAFGITDSIPPNGRLLRNIMLGGNFLQSHILHFYHLAAPDYVDVAALRDYRGSDSDLTSVKSFLQRGALEPFVPRYTGDYRLTGEENECAVKHYVEALDARKWAHELVAIFGGKMPHQCTVVAGGVGTQVTADKMLSALSYVRKIAEFIERDYIPDILLLAKRYPDHLEIGSGCGRFLAYGGMDDAEGTLFEGGLVDENLLFGEVSRDNICEHVTHSYYAPESAEPGPHESGTIPQTDKQGAYSWIKAPRYEGQPCEVGPLARAMVNYVKENQPVKAAVDQLLSAAGIELRALNSTLGRHATRALEAKLIADRMQQWILALQPGKPCNIGLEVPDEGSGAGLTAAPRGALGHWIAIEAGKIKNYQCVVPTTWNGSPRDSNGVPGPIEQALEGTRIKDLDNPFEIVRIIRSFDPCLACAVHLQRPRGATEVMLAV